MDSSWPPEIAKAFAEAAALGRDSSGRFRDLKTLTAGLHDDWETYHAAPGWNIWEGEAADSSGVLVYRRDRVELTSWILAVLFTGLTLVLVRSPRLRRLFVLAQSIGGLGLLLVFPQLGRELAPPFLFLSAMGMAASGQFRTGSKAGLPPTKIRSGVAVVSILLGLSAGLIAADSKRPEVFQTVGPDGKPTAIFVPTAVLDKLRAKQRGSPPSVVITQATYTGTRKQELRAFGLAIACLRFRMPFHHQHPDSSCPPGTVSLDGAEAREVEATADELKVTVAGRAYIRSNWISPCRSCPPGRRRKQGSRCLKCPSRS